MSARDLLKFKNMGRRGIREIKERLVDLKMIRSHEFDSSGINLEPEKESISNPISNDPRFKQVLDEWYKNKYLLSTAEKNTQGEKQ